MFSGKLMTQLARTMPQRLWLLVLPLAMLNAACAGLTSPISKSATVGSAPPTALITSPASGASVSGTITVTATASDNVVAVANVQFQVDGSNFGAVSTAAPYSASLGTGTLTNGIHSLTAVAINAEGNKGSSPAVSITVNNNSDTTPPTVSVTSPASGATVSGTITVTANASDNVAVASVQFQVDGSNLGAAVTSAPYSASLNTTTLTNGAHTLKAVATDTSNNKTTSAGVSITVNNQVTSPVSVSITSPVSGAIVSGTVTIDATATASAGVAGVQFLLDGADLGLQVVTSPYSMSWNTTTASAGIHTLSATAIDTSGNTATANANVTVSNGSQPTGWQKLSFTELQGNENVSPCTTPSPGGNVGCAAEIIAWGTAVADTKRNRLLIWNGGHTDYAGNEIYSIDLTQVGVCTSTNPCITRLDDYSPPNTSTACVETLSDGRPNSRHTYDGLAYIVSNDTLFSVGGSLNDCGNGSKATWELALSSVPQSCAVVNGTSPGCTSSWTLETSDYAGGETNITTAYDSIHNVVWAYDSSQFYEYSFASNTWAVANTNGGGTTGDFLGTMVFDDFDQYVIRIAGPYSDPGAIRYWSVANGSSYTLNTPALDGSCGNPSSGTGIFVGYPGVAWDPVGHVAVIYPGSGNQIYLLNPQTWTCTTESYGSTLGVDYPQNQNPSVNGMIKRFNYFPALDVFIMVNDYANDAWELHRLRAGADLNTTLSEPKLSLGR
jgi:hypothetical protein